MKTITGIITKKIISKHPIFGCLLLTNNCLDVVSFK